MTHLLNNKIRILILIVIGVITYFPIISSNEIVNPDAQLIIPILKGMNSFYHYFVSLFTLQTLDFQPIRDLSIYIDLKIFDLFGCNVSVIHNLILWIISAFIVHRTLEHIFKEITSSELFLISLAFMVYPLFTYTVSWGIARKHILSYLFIMLATERLLRKENEISLRDSIFINLFYACAIFAQPISILWAFWATLYIYLKNVKYGLKVIVPSLIIMAAGVIINFIYYSYSPVFLSSYSDKTNEIFEFSDKVLALGHYFFQILFPYFLSFTYHLGHWSTLAGIFIFGLFSYLLLGLRVDRKEILLWAGFFFFPVSIVIVKSTMLYDTYLLLPAFGLLVLVIMMKEKVKTYRYKYVFLSLLVVCWAGYSHYEAKAWTDELLLTQRGFERRPSCQTAIEFLRISYENAKPPESSEAKKFLFENECHKLSSHADKLLNLQANLLYYETDLSDESRVENLKRLSNGGIFPHMALAALLVRLNKVEEAKASIDLLIQRWGRKNYRNEYIPIASKVLHPFCKENNISDCVELLKPFLERDKGMSYK